MILCTALGNCGHVVGAKIFFVAYALVMLFVVIEMFVNVIMEKFEEQAELAHLPITVNDLLDFAQVWALFDPKAHGRIPEELFTIPPGSAPVQYPGGDDSYEKGLIEELNDRLPILGCNAEFEERRAAEVNASPTQLYVQLPN